MTGIVEKHVELLRDFYKKSANIIASSGGNSLYGITDGNPSTVLTTGYNENDKLKTYSLLYDIDFKPFFLNWGNIVKMTTDYDSVIGLTSEGKVFSAGETACKSSELSDLDVNKWSEIQDIAKGKKVTAALKKDGTVIATGSNVYGMCNVGHFKSIVQVVAGEGFVAGLRSDGKVDFAGVDASWLQQNPKNSRFPMQSWSEGYCYNTSTWANIIRLYVDNGNNCRSKRLFGLRKDGRVLFTGKPHNQLSCVEDWTDIVDLFVNDSNVVGIKKDGSIISTYAQDGDDAGICSEIAELSTKPGNVVYALPDSRQCLLLWSDGTVSALGFGQGEKQILNTWTNIVAIRRLDKDLVIGVKSNGKVLQTSYEPLTELNTDKMVDDHVRGVARDASYYEESYTIDTESWQLKCMDMEAYVLAVRMMLEGDAQIPVGLLKTIDYYANAKDLLRCLDSIGDKTAICKCALCGAKILYDFYRLNDMKLYLFNVPILTKFYELLDLIGGSDEAHDYLVSIQNEQKKIKEEFEEKKNDYLRQMEEIEHKKKSLQQERDRLSIFSIVKKTELRQRINALNKQYDEIHLAFIKIFKPRELLIRR